MDNNLIPDRFREPEGSSKIVVAKDHRKVIEYLGNFQNLEYFEAELQMHNLESDNALPYVLISGDIDYLNSHSEYLLHILRGYDILLEQDTMEAVFAYNFDKEFLTQLIGDFVTSTQRKASSILSMLNTVPTAYLPFDMKCIDPRSDTFDRNIKKILEGGIKHRTFLCFGGLYPEVVFVDNISYALDIHAQQKFLKQLGNFIIARKSKEIKFLKDSSLPFNHPVLLPY